MNPPTDGPAFEDRVRAMLHRRAEDIVPSGDAGRLDDDASWGPPHEQPNRWRPTRRQALVVAAACVTVMLGTGALVVGVGDEGGQSVKANQLSPTSTAVPTDPNPPVDPEAPTSPETPPPPETTQPDTVPPEDATTGPVPPDDATAPGPSAPPTGPTTPAGPGPTGTGVAPATPVVTVSQLAGPPPPHRSYVRGCDGTRQLHGSGTGLLRVDRSGPAGQPVVVGLEVTGNLAGSVTGLAPSLTIPAGQDMAVTSFRVGGTGAGQVTITIRPGSGYHVGAPASRTFAVAAATTAIDCLRPVPASPEVQTITVGQRPQDITFSPAAPALTDPQLVGTPPPGLGLGPASAPDTPTTESMGWTGAASAPGTYRLTFRHCISPAVEVIGSCDGTSVVTVTVREP